MTEPTTNLLTDKADLLIELGCEELPPRALDDIREAFFRAVRAGLEKHNLSFDAEGSRSYSSPRRLAVLFSDVAPSQPDQDQERRGPAINAAFDSAGKPTGAAHGFARSVGKAVSELGNAGNRQGKMAVRQDPPGGEASFRADLPHPGACGKAITGSQTHALGRP